MLLQELQIQDLINKFQTIKSGTNCDKTYPYVKWHNNLEWFDKQGNAMQFSNDYYSQHFTFITNDGTMILYSCRNQFLIDVNGFKNPNQVGRDIYYIIIPIDKILPSYPDSVNIPNCQSKASWLTKDNYKTNCNTGTGWGCSNMIINNEL